MRSLFLALVLLAVLSCAPAPSSAADDLGRMWAARTNSVEQLATAINAHFTKGTPMREVMAILGRQDTMIITTTLSWPPETQNRRVWVYRFGSKEILIGSTGGPRTPLEERGFAGARVVARGKSGQPDGAASRSQPVRAQTNQPPAAAGSGR